MNRNALDIKQAIVHHVVQRLNHVLVAVEPSMQAHDVWSMSKARYQYEWEVKRSLADLRREKEKYKHRDGGMEEHAKVDSFYSRTMPNFFTIVVPEVLASDAIAYIEKTPELHYSGLAVLKDGRKGPFLETVRKPSRIHKERAPLKRCSQVARWMSVTLCDLMGMTGAFKEGLDG